MPLKTIVTEYYFVSSDGMDVYFICGASDKERQHAQENYPNATMNFLPYWKQFLDYCKIVSVTERVVNYDK